MRVLCRFNAQIKEEGWRGAAITPFLKADHGSGNNRQYCTGRCRESSTHNGTYEIWRPNPKGSIHPDSGSSEFKIRLPEVLQEMHIAYTEPAFWLSCCQDGLELEEKVGAVRYHTSDM